MNYGFARIGRNPPIYVYTGAMVDCSLAIGAPAAVGKRPGRREGG